MPILVTARGSKQYDGRWPDAATVDAATGWQLKPEGLCRDEVCVIVPEELRDGDTVDAVTLWQRIGRPAITSGDAIYLGEDAATKPTLRAGDVAPDFALPDLAGVEHSLSDYRGKKVFISSWAPW